MDGCFKINKKAIALALLFVASSAHADWGVKVSDSAFDSSKNVLMVGSLENARGISYECEDGKLTVSYLEMNDKITVDPSDPVVGDMAVKVDKNKPTIFHDVKIHRQNPKYIALQSTDYDAIKASLSQIKNAKSKINVGVKYIDGNTYSMTGDSLNSTSAVNKFTKECDIQL